ncbi:hsp70-like protein [Phyllosticta citrichinensis]|uniref:Hsp70-like protein n=1 Tax=Phyllosticta citrichinensis TaxID=1130410 RepID=A0ABR1XM21_9PEZI
MASSLHKIIVGLDYGTTFSGVSYVTSNEHSFNKIEVISQWPGTSDMTSKVPSRIAYASENRNLGADTWGFAVTSSMESCSWTKLLLDRGTALTDFDDPALKKIMGSGMLRLPAGKLAKDVCQDYLTNLYHYTAETLSKKYSPEIYNITPVECWITVPAIWSDAAKDATRTAAITAGFGSRPLDSVNIITEPEAAALAALKPHLDLQSIDPVHPGETVLVCDCGGGTVDITTYQIMECRPRLKFKEVCVGMGGKLGSTYIDRNFNQFMIDTYGDAYTQIAPKKRGPGSAMMRSFETAKRTFGSGSHGRNEERLIEIEHVNMRAPSTWRFDEDEATLKITYQDMKSFFDPVVDDILRLITTQANHACKLGCIIDRVILVGGFGDSTYLMDRMKTWCTSQSRKELKLTCPPQCQAAIVKGAALRGLECIQPASRIARRHYGHGISLVFQEGIDPEARAFICDWTSNKYCSGRVEWGIKKGQNVDADTEVELAMYMTAHADSPDEDLISVCTIYCCDYDRQPRYDSDHGVQKLGTIVTKFSRAECRDLPKRYVPGRGRVMNLDFVLKIGFSEQDGLLVFTSYINGRQAGRTKVEFHDY